MLRLQKENLEQWFEKLPSDIQAAITDDFPQEDLSSDLEAFALKVENAELVDLQALLMENPTLVQKMGRIGRVRLLSHICDRALPYQGKFFFELFEEEEEAGEGEVGANGTKVLFIEDLKAFNEAVAVRIAKMTLTNDVADTLEDAVADEFAINPM